MQVYKPHLHLQGTSEGELKHLSIAVNMPAEFTISDDPTESVSGTVRTLTYAIEASSHSTAHLEERMRIFEEDEINLSTEYSIKVVIGNPKEGSGEQSYSTLDDLD